MWYNQTQLKPKKMLCEKLAQIRVFFNFLFNNKRLFLYCASGFRTSDLFLVYSGLACIDSKAFNPHDIQVMRVFSCLKLANDFQPKPKKLLAHLLAQLSWFQAIGKLDSKAWARCGSQRHESAGA